MKESAAVDLYLVKGFHASIEKEVLTNTNFKQFLYMSINLQIVLICLKTG